MTMATVRFTDLSHLSFLSSQPSFIALQRNTRVMASTRRSSLHRFNLPARHSSVTSTYRLNQRSRNHNFNQVPNQPGSRKSSVASISKPKIDDSIDDEGGRDSEQSISDHQTAIGTDQKIDQEIQMLKPTGWKLVKCNLRRVVEYGHKEGILTGDTFVGNQASSNAAGAQNEENENVEKQDDDVVKITTRDLSSIHAAIPFLPVPVAAFCFILNIVAPGTGTILSGCCALCMGQPRINFKEGRRFMTLLVNLFVGVAQMGTITFLLVGWFWSMAWGGLLVTHSLQYREALMQHRQEAVATAAIEALTRDAILRRRDVRTLVQERKQGQAAPSDYNRRRSMFSRFAKGGIEISVDKREENGAAVG